MTQHSKQKQAIFVLRKRTFFFLGNRGNDDKMNATNWLVTRGRKTMTLHSKQKHAISQTRRQKVKQILFLKTNTALLLNAVVVHSYYIADSNALRLHDLYKVLSLAPWLCHCGHAHCNSARNTQLAPPYPLHVCTGPSLLRSVLKLCGEASAPPR